MLLLFMLLLSCSGTNFSNLKLSSLKTLGEGQIEKSNKKDFNYVIGEDKDKEKNNKKSEDKEYTPDQIDCSEYSTLLDILNKDKKDYEKIQKEKNRCKESDIDLEYPTLLDILNKDKKDYEKIQKEKDGYKESNNSYSESKTSVDVLGEEESFRNSNNKFYESEFSYGYEKTIGYENEFFC